MRSWGSRTTTFSCGFLLQLWITFASTDQAKDRTTRNLFFRISYLLCYREIVSDKTHNMCTAAVGHPNPTELMSKTLLIKAYPKPSSILICLTDSRISRMQSEFSALASRIIRVMMRLPLDSQNILVCK